MGETSLHKSKRKKNIVVFGMVIAWCLLVFLVTMVKMARAHDISQTFIDQRTSHQKDMEEAQKSYERHWNERQLPVRKLLDQKMDEQRQEHLEATKTQKKLWDKDWMERQAPERAAIDKKMDEQREMHRRKTENNPEIWWENWEEKLDPEK